MYLLLHSAQSKVISRCPAGFSPLHNPSGLTFASMYQTFAQRLKYNVQHTMPMLLLTFLAALVLTFLLLTLGNDDIFLRINAVYSDFWDFFFRYYTWVGDGVSFVIVALILIALYRERWYLFTALVSTLGSLVLTQGLKRLVFDEALRPLAYFERQHIIIRTIVADGFSVHHHNTFPSGHTVSAFAMCMLLALWTPVRSLQVLYFVVAALAGFSRIYLSQHFPADVLAGMVAGTLLSLLAGSIWLPRPREEDAPFKGRSWGKVRK